MATAWCSTGAAERIALGPVDCTVRDAVALITLADDARRHTLGVGTVTALETALRQAAGERVRAAVLRAAPGSRVWSAGHDIGELATTRDPEGWDDAMRRAVRAVRGFPAPVIAAIEGSVWGGACEVALSCDVVLCTPETTFAITPARIGVPYSVTGTGNLQRCIPRAVLREMLFTAEPLAAERAERLGLVNRIVPADELERAAGEIARRIAANAPLAIAVLKEQMNLLEDGRAGSVEAIEHLTARRRQVWESADFREGLAAFAARRPPRFRGE